MAQVVPSRIEPRWPREILAGLAAVLGLLVAPLDVSLAQDPTTPPRVQELNYEPFPLPPELQGVDLTKQTAGEAALKSNGCIQCHQGAHDPHEKMSLRLGCVDCHGGDPATNDIRQAHVWPKYPQAWPGSGNPVRSYTLLNRESPEFIRFVNPGDFRIAHISCGTVNCHPREVLESRKSMMAHGAMLWSAALYNNGEFPMKWAHFGEAYSMHGAPLRMQTVPPPTLEEVKYKGVMPFLDPLPRYEMSQPGNVLRIFERGKKLPPEVGIPDIFEDPGRPKVGLSNRGLGTKNRTGPVWVSLNKTRLFDPTLNFMGTNDQPGDYRSSGCTSCHMIYANDRSPVNSGPYARFGNRGQSFSTDPTIPKGQRGHPIEHKLTTAIPTSQCIVCHVHPGTTVLQTYTGFMWWDEETDGELIWPKEQRNPSPEEYLQAQLRNPNEIDARNKLADPAFLDDMVAINSQARHTQFADYHGHGWAYKAVFKKDRHGNFLDHNGRVIGEPTTGQLMSAMLPPSPEERVLGKRRDGTPVHLMDIHLEKGMHCIDCHFVQDVHGNTKLYGEVRAAIEIQCIDCHGSVAQRANLVTSGPASDTSGPPGDPGRRLAEMRTPFGKRRFEARGNKIIQNSMVEKGLSWEVVQVADLIDPASDRYNEKAALAKTVHFTPDGRLAWGSVPGNDANACAHSNGRMSCIACHSSWNPSCFGCHLPQKANRKMPQLHAEGDISRNYTAYNWQTLRDDVFMLARDGDVTGNRIGPARSSCAVHVSSFNANRENIYIQQQTISAEGLSGIAFSTNVPHTVRGGTPIKVNGRSPFPEAYMAGHSETKSCTDCHLSIDDDNNAIMAQLLMHGTNYVNFMGRYCWVASGEHGLASVIVTEQDEPQTVIGSTMHAMAFPDNYREHVENGGELEHAYEHPGIDIGDQLFHPLREKPEIFQVQARGEYLYAACGAGGLRVFDIAFIDHKAFSERILTAPVSPLGQKFFVPTTYATALAAPTTIAPDPTRTHFPINNEQKVPLFYAFIYVTDKYEGLVLVGAGTLLDGNPLNNFLKRELTFNPGNILCGARAISVVGTYAYISCDAGLVVVDLTDPLHPNVTSVLGHEILNHPTSVATQFRYAFVTDHDGVKVLDITDLAHPTPVTALELEDAHSIYVARTYAYVAAGHQGLVILNVENPTQPRIDQIYNANGCINDLHDVKLGITYASEFAYLADGKNGLRVVQLTSPETPGNQGFSPRPTPNLIATFTLPNGGHALNVGEAVDRDRAVDESGNQIAVFGRVGARPLDIAEQRKMYLHDGQVWKVSDEPRSPVYSYTGPAGAAPPPGLAPPPPPPVDRRRTEPTQPIPPVPSVSPSGGGR